MDLKEVDVTFHIGTVLYLKMKKVNKMKEELVAEGKTKRIFKQKGSKNKAVVESLDDITAGDGTKHDIMESKAEYANETTCNVFELLKREGIPVAFVEKLGPRHFSSLLCTMIPLEVVVRRIAMGSYLQRNKEAESGDIFEKLVIEFYLKTKDKKFKGIELPYDDPYFEIFNGSVFLYNAHAPLSSKVPINSFEAEDVFNEQRLERLMPRMEDIAEQVFLCIERAWKNLGYTMADFKIEFGLTKDGDLVVADVIDNDSWRVLDTRGQHIDKQLYRDGADFSSVKKKYKEVAELTKKFLS